MNLLEIAHNIELKDNGIYFAKSESKISYPEEGNEHCMQIEEDSFWFNHRNNVIAEAVKQFSPKKTFFDIGGGNGYVSIRLQQEGIETVLVEPGIAGALNAKKRGLSNVICSTLEDGGFENESVESAGMFDVVEHIEDDNQFLKDIFRFLKPGGFVYITVPAYNSLWSKEDDDAGHYRRYTIKQMNSLLKSVGFEIAYSTYIFSVLPLPILLLRSVPSKLGLNKNSNDLEKHQKEHQSNKGALTKMMDKVWKWELARVKKLKKINAGGSCFVVATKRSNKM